MLFYERLHSRVAAVFLFAILGLANAAAAQPATTLKIGITLHPYYSWTANVVGKLPGYEVRPILPGEIDAGDYQPRPEDIKKITDLDAIVVNGIGHDDFIMPMIKASGNKHLVIIRVNERHRRSIPPMARASTRTPSSPSRTPSSRPTRSPAQSRRFAPPTPQRCRTTRPTTRAGSG